MRPHEDQKHQGQQALTAYDALPVAWCETSTNCSNQACNALAQRVLQTSATKGLILVVLKSRWAQDKNLDSLYGTFTLIMECAARQRDCPQQLPVEIWWCKMAAKWNEVHYCCIILHASVLQVRNSNDFYCVPGKHFYQCVFRTVY